MIVVMSRKERNNFIEGREEIFRVLKKDVVIYKYKDEYYLHMINSITICEFKYSSIDELIDEAYNRSFFKPYNLTKVDYIRLEELRKQYR